MYDLIYIYEFEGDLSREIAKIIDADYIGFWKKSKYSFLFFKQPKGSFLVQLPLPVRSELVIRHEDWESVRRWACSRSVILRSIPHGIRRLKVKAFGSV